MLRFLFATFKIIKMPHKKHKNLLGEGEREGVLGSDPPQILERNNNNKKRGEDHKKKGS